MSRDAQPEGGGAVLISGEAGVGKTRLVVEALPPEGILAWIRYPGARFATPGLGLHRLAEVGGAEADKLRAELDEPDVAPSGFKLPALLRAADEILRAKAPNIVVLDDLQWADELTLAWLSHSTDLLESTSVYLILIVRTPDRLPPRITSAVAPLVRRRRLEVLHLGPLDLDAVRTIAQAYGFDSAAPFIAQLHERTDGLPLAVEELLRLAARGSIQHALESPRTVSEPAVPPVIAMIVREELDALDSDAHGLLAAASLLPQPASEKALRTVTRLPEERFDVALDSGLGSGLLVRPASGVITFRHDLQREAVQVELSVATRRSMHRRIADVLTSDPDVSPGEIANQFIEAGEIDEAIGWLERAADESAQAHDHGNALTHLATALELCPPERAETGCRLIEKVVPAARYSNQQRTGLALLDSASPAVTNLIQRGRLLVCRARLVQDVGDFRSCVDALTEARTVFSMGGDDARRAWVLGALALPADSLLTIAERVTLGREGLDLAERAADPLTIALCAGNLAAAELLTANAGAFDLWSRAIEAIDPEAGPEHAAESLRNRYNWASVALDYGSYAQAGSVIRDGLKICTGQIKNPHWERSFRNLDVLRLWRMGRWDDAQPLIESSRDLPDPELAVVSVLRVAIAFERERRPDLSGIRDPMEVLTRYGGSWRALAQSILMRIRAARREPRPSRGLMSLVEEIVASGFRIGWDDLLPAAAAVDLDAYRRMLAVLGDLEPFGERAEAAKLCARGLLADRMGEASADEMLVDAASAYELLEEPYAAAQALQSAVRAKVRRGRNATDVSVRAAELYAQVGAYRSLASLLRSAPRSRALEPFRALRSRIDSRGLSVREREVADLACRGYTSRDISEQLNISIRTVEKHIQRVKDKLGVDRKSELVRLLSDDYTSGEHAFIP